ncbi:phosphatase [Thorsellia anophelis]|uniref:Putative hydrolase n=1 Tax=Thorsellia anophelis DSM 18579 TaxID=1123402 RepID=A0A1H9ZQN7_9GAMM|nr:phosphatase [Thorsellia anophelis]SES83918.1 putative hydrolase [Thorsellia anophelis DSM 18579]
MFPVDLHMHTVASTHAYSTIHDYIPIAKKKGIKLLAITDHGPDMADAPHYWHFMNLRIWPRVIEDVGVLRGIEANIKNQQGDIDCTGPMLKAVDLVLAGFHEPVYAPQNIFMHTEALIAAISNGDVHIISHPGNPKFPIDINEVAKAAAEYGVALELNNSSFTHSRVGSAANCLKIAEAVRDAGGLLSIGSDSHIAYHLGDFPHCELILQKTEFPLDRVINQSPKKTLDFLASRGRDYLEEFKDIL